MRVTETAADVLRATLSDGDVAIDGTAGRGRDTLLLAGLVGASGRVHAFDVQAEAIDATRALLA
ncbi:MAG: rRNA methyltransferase, partial [Verrucomicrobiota bacterium]